MEVVVLIPYVLGLLLLPLLAVALCVRCREMPGEWGLPGDQVLGPGRTWRDLRPSRTPHSILAVP